MNAVWLKRGLSLQYLALLLNATQLEKIVSPSIRRKSALKHKADTSQSYWFCTYRSLQKLDCSLSFYSRNFIIRIGKILSIFEGARQKLASFSIGFYEATSNTWRFKQNLVMPNWCKNLEVSWHGYLLEAVSGCFKSCNRWSKPEIPLMTD